MPGFLAILIGGCATVGFILIFAASKYQNVRLWRGIGSLLLGLPLGLLSYGWLGIRLARVHGTSRFYSWPFGESSLGHGAVIVSGLVWVVAWFVLLFLLSNLLPAEKSALHRKEITR